MNLEQKLEIAKRSIVSILCHDDDSLADREKAASDLTTFIVAEQAEARLRETPERIEERQKFWAEVEAAEVLKKAKAARKVSKTK